MTQTGDIGMTPVFCVNLGAWTLSVLIVCRVFFEPGAFGWPEQAGFPRAHTIGEIFGFIMAHNLYRLIATVFFFAIREIYV
jgi:hypothetical protein